MGFLAAMLTNARATRITVLAQVGPCAPTPKGHSHVHVMSDGLAVVRSAMTPTSVWKTRIAAQSVKRHAMTTRDHSHVSVMLVGSVRDSRAAMLTNARVTHTTVLAPVGPSAPTPKGHSRVHAMPDGVAAVHRAVTSTSAL